MAADAPAELVGTAQDFTDHKLAENAFNTTRCTSRSVVFRTACCCSTASAIR